MSVEPLSIVIVSHLGGELLTACVESLQGQLQDGDQLEVFLSAEPGRADTAELRCHPIHLGENVGFAKAANVGFARAKHDRILLLNDDTRAEPGFLSALREASDCPGIYQPKILLDDDSGCLDNVGHALFPDGFNWARGRGQADGEGDRFSEAQDIVAFSGAAMLIRKEVLEAIGPFDEDLQAFGEDVDLSLRAVRAGFAIRAVPEARIRHKLGASYGRYNTEKLYLVERNRMRAAVRSLPVSALITMPIWTGLRFTWLSCASFSSTSYVAGVGSKGARAAARGVLAGTLSLPDAWKKRRADAQDWTLSEVAMCRRLLKHRVRFKDLLQ